MENKKTCSECGCIIEGDAVIIDGEAYCADCAAEWLKGLKPDTVAYIQKVKAFEEVL